VSQISKEYLEKEYLNLKKRRYKFEQLYSPYWKKRAYESLSLVC
jgi:hypothetical protein